MAHIDTAMNLIVEFFTASSVASWERLIVAIGTGRLLLYLGLVEVGMLSLVAVARARRGSFKPGDLGVVSPEWRADQRARGGTD